MFDPLRRKVIGQTWLLEPDFLQALVPRQSQIFACETAAPLGAIFNLTDIFKFRDLIFYIDNESACSALIRGASRAKDVDCLVISTHLALARSLVVLVYVVLLVT